MLFFGRRPTAVAAGTEAEMAAGFLPKAATLGFRSIPQSHQHDAGHVAPFADRLVAEAIGGPVFPDRAGTCAGKNSTIRARASLLPRKFWREIFSRQRPSWLKLLAMVAGFF